MKRTLRNEDDPELMRMLGQLKYVMKRLKRRIDEGAVRIVEDGFLLDGNLYFEAEQNRCGSSTITDPCTGI